MLSGFYLKIAGSNIRKNAKTYVPYLLTCIITIAMFYIIVSLSLNTDLKNLLGAEEITYMLQIGSNVVAIFAVIFLFYTHSFLMKQRKKEFGLFNILGMGKRHIARIMLDETILSACISISLGLLIGVSLDKVMFLVIARMFDVSVPLGFHFSLSALRFTCLLFTLIFILILVNALFQVYRSNAIELLHSSEFGEKEPNSKWLLTLLGLTCLGTGYYIALVTQNPVAALGNFFLAVVLVIIGTYLVFIAGITTILKQLKKNKTYYYKPNHFISVSGLIYRMKLNAVGLANICILSTMVLVMLSSTISLWVGIDDLAKTRYPNEITLYSYDERDMKEDFLAISDSILEKTQLEKSLEVDYDYLSFSALRQKNFFNTDNSMSLTMDEMDDISNLFFVTLEDFNRGTGSDYTLDKDEIFVYANRLPYQETTLQLFDQTFRLKGQLDDFLGNGIAEANIANSYYIVLPNRELLEAIESEQQKCYQSYASKIKQYVAFDINGDKEQRLAYAHQLAESLDEMGLAYELESRSESYNGILSLYGGFLFIGIFLSILFIMATILIIYYKQISEGYEDKNRYEIMQKVGMDHRTVKKAINSQVLTVFFLPLVMATIHVVFAFPIVQKILSLLYLTNTHLYIASTIGCLAIFTVVYIIIYAITSKCYYGIVKRD